MWGEVKSLGEILTDNGVGYYAQKAKIKVAALPFSYIDIK